MMINRKIQMQIQTIIQIRLFSRKFYVIVHHTFDDSKLSYILLITFLKVFALFLYTIFLFKGRIIIYYCNRKCTVLIL